MTSFKSGGKISFLSQWQINELSRHFTEPDRTAMPHELAIKLKINYSDALTIISLLETEGLSNNLLLIYHNCQEAPVDTLPFGAGFPNLPWKCPNCEVIVEDGRELSYDLMAKAPEPIEFF